MLKISSSLVRQVNAVAFEEVVKKKAVTKKVEETLSVLVCSELHCLNFLWVASEKHEATLPLRRLN